MDTFRADLRAWLSANAPASLHHTVSTPFQGYWGGASEFRTDDERRWFEVCRARGWTAPRWPVAYGGGGMSADEHRVWREELTALGMPLPLVGLGLTMLGPILLAYGTEAQKAAYLPAIVDGSVRWCQGYSEPGAGSDLASVRTRAVPDGADFLVDGQKIWTSHADKADWIFLLVRTSSEGPRQAGITFLLCDMRSPGITVRPIELISGASPFCEVFLEGVRVPQANVIGRVNEGWSVAKALLGHEREMVGESIAAGGARPDALRDYGLRAHAERVLGCDAAGRIDDALVEAEVARFERDEAALRLLIRRHNDKTRFGHHPGPEASIAKVLGAELNQRRWEIGLQIGGLDTLGWEGPGFTEQDTALARHWLRSRGNSIEGGSSEVQRNILARHVLGLPMAKGA